MKNTEVSSTRERFLVEINPTTTLVVWPRIVKRTKKGVRIKLDHARVFRKIPSCGITDSYEVEEDVTIEYSPKQIEEYAKAYLSQLERYQGLHVSIVSQKTSDLTKVFAITVCKDGFHMRFLTRPTPDHPIPDAFLGDFELVENNEFKLEMFRSYVKNGVRFIFLDDLNPIDMEIFDKIYDV